MIRIGTGTSAVDPSALRVAGVAPSKIMLGTGSAAVEVWSASIYPVSGTGSGTMDLGGEITIGSHTIAEHGFYTLTHLVTGQGIAWGVSAIKTPSGNASGPGGNSSLSTLEVTLKPGDVVEFTAQNVDWGFQTYSGSWSIVKN